MEKNLKNLNNPLKVVEIVVCPKNKKGYVVGKTDSQEFQETSNAWELWEEIDGHLMKIKMWLKQSIAVVYV